MIRSLPRTPLLLCMVVCSAACFHGTSLLAQLPAGVCTAENGLRQTVPTASSAAYWIDRYTVAVPAQSTSGTLSYYLYYDPSASLSLTVGNPVTLSGSQGKLALSPATLTSAESAEFPPLLAVDGQGNPLYSFFHLPSGTSDSVYRSILQDQVLIGVISSNKITYATGIQDAGTLDYFFPYTGKLGAVFTGNPGQAPTNLSVRVWAPTAQDVTLYLYQTDPGSSVTTPPAPPANLQFPMTFDPNSGVWNYLLGAGYENWYYVFNIKSYRPLTQTIVTKPVTDPYSDDLSINGLLSRLTDLDDPATMPTNWATEQSPALTSPGDMSIYELEVSDFSHADTTVTPASYAGTYLAFTDQTSAGMTHLATLASAGLKAVHLLPTFHFDSYYFPNNGNQTFTLSEDSSLWYTYPGFGGYGPGDCNQQQIIWNNQYNDSYDWGYEPVHYMAPEGAYATNPSNRVEEYRSMVAGLHTAGLRIIQDSVFNHTDDYGHDVPPFLDDLVPEYYYRLDSNGTVLTTTCCYDTAPEHAMMEKLIIDTVEQNITEYHIDGFRFDLMASLPKQVILDLQAAIAGLSPENGSASLIYLYGEGQANPSSAKWFTNADQQNMAGTGVGTYNDVVRAAVRGPENNCTWDSTYGCFWQQGIGNGLFTDPNSLAVVPPQSAKTALLQYSDFMRASLAGSLKGFTFTNYNGNSAAASSIAFSYGTSTDAGFTNDPVEAVNNVTLHDGMTIFDDIQLKAPYGPRDGTNDDITRRVRRQILSQSFVALAQGIPFFGGGDDALRSRDFYAESNNAGNWFNDIDWSFNTNSWGKGLPKENSSNEWETHYFQPLLRDTSLNPEDPSNPSTNNSLTRKTFQEFLKIRESSGLFHMAVPPFSGGSDTNLSTIQGNLTFLNTGANQIPGVIVMKLDNAVGSYTINHFVVVFNATLLSQCIADASFASHPLVLDSIQLHGSDPVVQTSSYSSGPCSGGSVSGSVTVPSLTTAVFVRQ